MQVGGIVVLDTETTGLNSTAEVIQFAALYLSESGQIEKATSFYCNVDSHIPKSVVDIHGISNEELIKLSSRDGVPQYFETLIKEVDWVISGDNKYTSYNWDFDNRVIQSSLTMQGLPEIDFGLRYRDLGFEGRGCFDSMAFLSGKLNPSRNLKLGTLFKKCYPTVSVKYIVEQVNNSFGLYQRTSAPHDAMYDCVMLASLLTGVISGKLADNSR